MKNYLIVESQNDKFFIEAMIRNMKLLNIEVSGATICGIDDYECMDGLNSVKLTNAIEYIKDKSEKIPDEITLGIIIDWDSDTLEQRLRLINDALNSAFNKNVELTSTKQLVEIENGFYIACYFNGVKKQGELETVLKKIASCSTRYADCLDAWQSCLGETPISTKDFDKFWVAQYIRYDTCTKKEMKRVSQYCTFEKAMKKPIWNFEHEILEELKEFLSLFKT